MVDIIVIVVAFIVLHFFDKWLIEKGVQNPLVYSIVCGGFCIAGIIVRFALSGVYSDFVAKLDFVDFIFGSAQSVGDVICRYLIFISAFMCMPHIPDITWEDEYTEYLTVSKGKKGYLRDNLSRGAGDYYSFKYTTSKGESFSKEGELFIKEDGDANRIERSGRIDGNSEWTEKDLDRLTEKFDKIEENRQYNYTRYSRDIKEVGAVPGLAIKLIFVLAIYAFLFLAVAQGESAPTDFFSTMLGAVILLVPTCLIEFGVRKLINKILLKQADQEYNK